jgi:NCS2 family nucleobase:cation symporter-2
MMTQRLLDNRRALTIGFALMVGLSFEQLLPALHLPPGVRTALDSSLLTAVAVALLLNAVFRIGIRRSMEREWQVSEGPLALRETMDHWGRQWGARADLVRRAQDFLEEFAQAAALISTPGKAASIRATYDEVSLRFDLRWHGSAVAKAGTTPSLDDADESLDHSLAVALMRHRADHLSFDSLGPDTQRAVATLDDH